MVREFEFDQDIVWGNSEGMFGRSVFILNEKEVAVGTESRNFNGIQHSEMMIML